MIGGNKQIGIVKRNEKKYLSLSDPLIRRTTWKIKQLHETYLRDAAETVVEVGQCLIKIKPRLKHGHWIRWIEDYLHFSTRSVENYMNLAGFARTHARIFGRFKELGPTKLYVIASLERKHLGRIIRKKYWPISDSNKTKTLAQMSIIEFYEVLNKLTGQKKFSWDSEFQGFQTRVGLLNGQVKKLLPYADRIPAEKINAMENQLETLLTQIRSLKK